ncbi:MAG: carboxylesterase family protein [Burkholderiales bacterium]
MSIRHSHITARNLARNLSLLTVAAWAGAVPIAAHSSESTGSAGANSIALNPVYYDARPMLETKNGTLQGIERNGMVMFKNIPYAAPPVGDLRWRPPQPAQPWVGVRDASRFGPACMQPLIDGLTNELVPGSEDCLHLNVFAPKGAKNRPVMLWIHGGGLLTGSASEPYYHPVGLVAEDVIVVTIDYRLGRLGFFAPKELVEEARKNGEPFGNYGIMDQIQALKWVRDNIATFGGDPGNVTIFGQSAGGRSVAWLMTSPAAAGLFHKAIAQSPQQLPMRQLTQDRFGALAVQANDQKFIEAKGNKTLKELRALPAAEASLTAADFITGGFDSAMIDGEIILGDAIPMFAQGKQHKVPFMIGTNAWDASFFALNAPPVAAYIEKMKQDPAMIARLYKDFRYQCGQALSPQIMADGWYTGAVKLLADSANKAAPAYAYYYNFITPSLAASYVGPAHTFELPYVFGALDTANLAPGKIAAVDPCQKIAEGIVDAKQKSKWSDYWFIVTTPGNRADRSMAQQLAKTWTSFAKTGNPNYDGKNAWPRYNIEDDVMRNFSTIPDATITRVNKARVDYQLEFIRAFYGLR